MVFAMLFGGYQKWQAERLRGKLAETRALWDAERTRLNQVALDVTREFRETERRWIEAVQEGQRAIEQARKDMAAGIARVRAAASADAGILRQRLAAASSGGATPSDPGAATSGDAATCGQLLADALHVAGECTAGAESHADTVRALLRAWPVRQL